VPIITVSGSGLTGGLDGTSPTIAYSNARPYSSNILFDPVPYSMLYSVASSPQVVVTVNGLKSVCISDCSYSFIPNIPTIASQTTSNNGVNVALTITDPTSQIYSNSALTIAINGVPCTISQGTYPQLSCSIETSPDGNPMISAGNYNA
jgi:hypothetical protein